VRLEITRRADLAVRAMGVLGATPDRLKAPALAEALGTTVGFVSQVMAPLVKAGWVRSDPGPTGGYALRAPLAGVSVLDVIEATDGPTDTGRCVVADRPCNAVEPCALHEGWTLARAELLATLATTPLTPLVERQTR
jgi:Rrf2 family protein